ncbi:hypothetical protein K0M31_001797 [Melipona bicolor]|uniref:Uncharacterized protein n=1 Tax=Melipona bicolor TaxID=60889 RepID=A0AA40KXY5_9HYME|nr:hypothetical protein K0M31_001797 [Melipona bicolor]
MRIRTFLNALKTKTNPENPERIAALTHPAAQPLLIALLCRLHAHSSPQQHRQDLFIYLCGLWSAVSTR